jgi:hypothetical protein
MTATPLLALIVELAKRAALHEPPRDGCADDLTACSQCLLARIEFGVLRMSRILDELQDDPVKVEEGKQVEHLWTR